MSLPLLTPQQRLARQEHKRQTVLRFLVSETWTALPIVCRLLKLSPREVARTLNGMVRDDLLIKESIAVTPRQNVNIYGISAGGIAACPTAPVTTPEHQQGRLTLTNLPHSLRVQEVRVIAEAAGWTAWVAGRELYNQGLPTIPDAVATDPQSRRVAFEIERHVKSRKRSAEVVSGHVVVIAQRKLWQCVLYLADHRCDASRLQQLYMSHEKIDTPSGKAPMTDTHRARFQFVNIADFVG